MGIPHGSLGRTEIDRVALAFEAVWFAEGRANLRSFLPAEGTPEFAATLRELACIELELCWSRGQRRYVEEYLQEFPALASDAASLRELAEQERRARLEAGDPVARDEYASRLGLHLREEPERESALRAGSLPAAALPASALELRGGDRIAGFRLLEELGRGTFGRVFLAEQDDLARRQVVVKVGESLFDESQRLAQLQHGNIVPIYSAHRCGDLQLLCMPYFGRKTLSDVLAQRRGASAGRSPGTGSTLERQASVTRNGRADGALLPTAQKGPSAWETQPPHLPRESSLEIVAQLADGLAHAHERGIVHRDLKPANVLLADDGTPLLLDFNLAADQAALARERVLLGGTLPYMAPEQLQSLIDGKAVLDGRSDLFALGVILYEMLAGQLPFPPREGPWNKRLAALIKDRRGGAGGLRWPQRGASPAVRAIVSRCLAADPEERYTSAAELAEDLRRQLQNLPLRHAREPSLLERGRKFMRRHPRLTPLIAVTLLLATVAGVAMAAVTQGRRAVRAEATNVRRQFGEELADARMLLSLPYPQRDELDEGEQLIKRALARYGLPAETQWQSRPVVRALDRDQQSGLTSELREGLMLQARAAWLAGRWTADAGQREQRFQQAQALNQCALSLAKGEGERKLVAQQRSQFELSGLMDPTSEEAVTGNPLSESAEALGWEAAASAGLGNYRAAAQQLAVALRKQPGNAALWAQLGACLEAIGKLDQAAAAYSTCIALRPAWWRSYVWRGRVWLELKQWDEAALDLDNALAQRPRETAALALRSLARIGQKHFTAADSDLTRAIEISPHHTRLYFMRSRVRGMDGNRAGAAADLALGLRQQPTDEVSWISRGMARLPKEPQGALEDFEEALKLNPWSREAAQNKAHVLSERLGRTAEAIATLDPIVDRFPDFVLARIGRGVLLAREGKREKARQDADESLRRDRRPLVLYQAACIHALNSRQVPADRAEALSLLQRAVREGFGAEWIAEDNDLSSLREEPEFIRLVGLLKSSKTLPPMAKSAD